MNQKTIKEKILIEGITLHSGEISKIKLEPANDGIYFNGIRLSPIYIFNTKGMTQIGELNQIEHILSALYALEIDNIDIKVDKKEMPILDGCSKEYIDIILKTGIIELDKPRKNLKLEKKIEVKLDDSIITFTPHDKLYTSFECIVDFPYVGEQKYSWNSDDFNDYYENISGAKTFFWDKQYIKECDINRCLGLQKDENCLIFNNKSKYYKNELAKHKLLDLIGDLNVLNLRIPGKFTAYKPGHTINNLLVKKIWNNIVLEEKIKLPIKYFKFSTNFNLENTKKEICDCLDNRAFINSKYVTELEDNVKRYQNCKYAFAVNSGTSALMVSILSLKLPKNSIIGMPNLTFWATYEAIKLLGYRALIIDVDDNYQLNVDLLEKVESEYQIKAVITVHLYGYVSEQFSRLKKFCNIKNIGLIEDGSHAFGTIYNNKMVFQDSDLAAISLYPTKILGSNGNAGLIITNSDNLAKNILMFRDNGRQNTRYDHYEIGGNFIINSIQAIYCNEFLKNFKYTINRLNTISRYYRECFKDLKTMKYLSINNCKENGYMAILTCKLNNFSNVFDYLKKNEIDVNSIYSKTIVNQSGFDKEDYYYLNGKSDYLSKNVINLPIHYDLSPEEQYYLISKIKKIDVINIIIIGLGRMGKFHLKEIEMNDSYNIIGYIDPYLNEYKNYKKLNDCAQAKKLGANFAIISSNSEYHYECILDCINNNINFLVEKPALLSLEEHLKINNLFKKTNLYGYVGLIERFNDSFNSIDFSLQFDKIEITRFCRIPNNNDTDNLLFDLVIHDIDLLQYHFRQKIKLINIIKINLEYKILLYINEIPVYLNIGYSNEINKREYLFFYRDKNLRIDLVKNNSSLRDEHNDFINIIKNNNGRLCSLEESLELTKTLDNLAKNIIINPSVSTVDSPITVDTEGIPGLIAMTKDATTHNNRDYVYEREDLGCVTATQLETDVADVKAIESDM